MYKYLELVNEKNKFLNHIIKQYCENPREQKRKFILAYMKKCSVFRYWPFLVTMEIKGKHFYQFETYIDEEIYNSKIEEGGMIEELTIDEAVKFIERENTFFDYKIDYIQIDTPDNYSFIFTIDEYKKYKHSIRALQIEKETWINENNDNTNDNYKNLSDLLNLKLCKSNINKGESTFKSIKKRKTYNSIDLDIKPSELIVIGGRTYMGKTQLSINTLISEIDTKNSSVLYITLADRVDAIASRILNVRAQMPFLAIAINEYSKSIFERLKGAIKELKRIEIIGCSTYNIEEIIRAIKNDPFESNLIIIDDFQSIHYKNNYPSSDKETLKIAKQLKSIAKSLQRTIIVTSQIDRNIEKRKDKRPKIKDLKGPKGLGEVADKVYMLYRDRYYKEEFVDGLIETLEINEVKNNKKIVASFNLKEGTIYEKET